MKTAFIVGFLFLVFGLLIAIIGLGSTPVDRWVTGAGLVVAVLGGIAIPHSGLGGAFQTIIVNVGPYLPKIGGSRAGDPPAVLPGTAPPTDAAGKPVKPGDV